MIYSDRGCAATIVESIKDMDRLTMQVDRYAGNVPLHIEEGIEQALANFHAAITYLNEKERE